MVSLQFETADAWAKQDILRAPQSSPWPSCTRMLFGVYVITPMVTFFLIHPTRSFVNSYFLNSTHTCFGSDMHIRGSYFSMVFEIKDISTEHIHRRTLRQNIIFFKKFRGAQWLSGRVLDSRPRGRMFELHRRHCVVVLEQDTFILA